MSAFYTISMQWTIFQALGLSPYNAIGSKCGKQFRIIYILVMTVTYSYFMYSEMSTVTLDRRSFAKLLSSLIIFCMKELVHIIGLIIFIELHFTGHRQDAFLYELTKIDGQLMDCLQIDMDYKGQKRRHMQLFKQWFKVVVIARSIAALLAFNPSVEETFAVLPLAVIYFTVSLRMYQYTMFANMIKLRYALINQYINDTYNSNCDDGKNAWMRRLVESVEFSADDESVESKAEMVGAQRLRDLRDICRSIHATSQYMNELFPVSLSLCIFYDFSMFFLFSYDTFKYTFLDEYYKYYTLMTGTITLASANNLFTMSSICEETIQEVIFLHSLQSLI